MEEKKKCEWLSKHYIVIYIVYLLSLFLFWYFWLPFLNFRDISFYFYLMLVLAFPVAIIYAIIKKRYQKMIKIRNIQLIVLIKEQANLRKYLKI